jgi:hypothetical protein
MRLPEAGVRAWTGDMRALGRAIVDRGVAIGSSAHGWRDRTRSACLWGGASRSKAAGVPWDPGMVETNEPGCLV